MFGDSRLGEAKARGRGMQQQLHRENPHLKLVPLQNNLQFLQTCPMEATGRRNRRCSQSKVGGHLGRSTGGGGALTFLLGSFCLHATLPEASRNDQITVSNDQVSIICVKEAFPKSGPKVSSVEE